jgi:type I restriction enzyme M protein
MSEELISRNLLKKGFEIGEYEFFPTHSTTIKQYKQAKIINNLDYGTFENKKTDGLLIDRRNKNNQQVILVVEYKKPIDFQTEKQKKNAIEQCNSYCQSLKSKIGVITDGIITYWINPNHKTEKSNYSFILKEDKQKLSKKFFIKEKNQKKINKLDDETKENYEIINRILEETNKENSILKKSDVIDPTNLAKSVWQSIYVSTKENPTACLYNVVEIFIFKFLSDLGVLTGNNSFNHLYTLYEDNSEKEVLKHYASACRNKIKELFKEAEDGTTIINGTIFVNREGDPVLSQSTLFKNTIKKYYNFGNLKNVKKEFKTKLFETFLKQSKDKNKLGQFFTPRKVVKAICEMADIDKSKFICDGFCGVGGFVLEPLQISNNLKNSFLPKNKEINSNIKLLGLDCGREDSDEARRTIILAKANMLIYLSDIVEKNPTLTDEYNKLINDSFKFLTDTNLGTLNYFFKNEEDKPDLIITNPPYITSGTKTIREEIKKLGLENYYSNSGQGVEGLCLRWIIENLKKGGTGFIILPDGIFNNYSNDTLRKDLLKKCFIKGIVSLPIKTFFNTPRKTYILIIEKKQNKNIKQDFPVFTYLVSKIGETLDINRFEEEENDLENCKNLFNQFKGSPKIFENEDKRFKKFDIEKFKKEDFWIIDKWWGDKELEKLGIKEKNKIVSIKEFKEEISNFKNKLENYERLLENL